MVNKTVKFNAGKVRYDEETKRCTSLPHKGIVTIKPSAEDEDFFDFTWAPKSNSSGNVEKDELLIIPGDVSFKQIKSCKTGRVFALTFLSSGAKYLYWLQDVGDDEVLDKLTEKDEALVKEINDIVSLTEEEDDEEEEEEEQPQPEVKKEQEGNSHLETSSKSISKKQTELKLPVNSISDVLSVNLIEKHLGSLSPEKISELYSKHLPESVSTNPTKADVLDVVRSGFFQQAANNLSESLSNGAGYLLAQSLKYDYRGEGVDGFLAGIRELAKKEKEQEEEEKNGDEEMQD